MSLRANGSYIGPRPDGPSSSVASGIWDLRTAERQKRAAAWPLASRAAANDANFGSVQLLLPMDGANGSTTFSDVSNNQLSVTASGNAQIKTDHSKFGGASGYFDGTGDFLTVNNAAIAIGTGDFTIEAWGRLDSGNTTFRHIFDTRPSDSAGFSLGVDDSNRVFLFSVDTFRVQAGTVSANTWYHFALCRNGGNVRVFLDGTQVGTTWVNSANYSQQLLYIGKYFADSEFQWRGYLDDVRLTVGVGRYTAAFTPPAAGFID